MAHAAEKTQTAPQTQPDRSEHIQHAREAEEQLRELHKQLFGEAPGAPWWLIGCCIWFGIGFVCLCVVSIAAAAMTDTERDRTVAEIERKRRNPVGFLLLMLVLFVVLWPVMLWMIYEDE